ncbi:hypothetical protein ARMSODRAFT_979272 [Armillaria solidipes]|uniref:Uncharacterized protein n=1 Tax=Armillaria solidipes TaxID=1076256 RepID=A0A2H3AZS6_9AGAR|nr:hypothetical protein ARMSODRAFT_979272 [Armillaria solidipes]
MAQIGLAVFAGDQIYSYGIRLIEIGSSLLILCLCKTLVAWYIGAARGNGNHYGVVIITVRDRLRRRQERHGLPYWCGLHRGNMAEIGGRRGDRHPCPTTALTAPFMLKSITYRFIDKAFWIGVTTIFASAFTPLFCLL